MANTDNEHFNNFGEMIDFFRDDCTALTHIKEAWEHIREQHADKPTAYRFIRLHKSIMRAFFPASDSCFKYTMSLLCHALASELTPEELEELRNQPCNQDSIQKLLDIE